MIRADDIIHGVGFLAVISALVFPAPSIHASGDAVALLTGPTMGTTYAVKIGRSSEAIDVHALHIDIDRILTRINHHMSTYQSDSELSRVNANGTTEWMSVSRELFTVADEALRVSRLTNGAFDVTVGTLVNLWGFGPDIPTALIPSDEAIREAMRTVGFHHLQLQSSPPAIRKDHPNVYIDLSAIAQGYAVDQVAEYLESAKIFDYLVEISGEIRVGGRNASGEPWMVAIERPAPLTQEIQRVLQVENRAIATSGDYRNYIEWNGRRFSHTIDPKTGKPVTHTLASVTVIEASSMIADALATGLMVLGPDAGYDLAVREQIAALFLVHDAGGLREKSTPAFQRHIVDRDP